MTAAAAVIGGVAWGAYVWSERIFLAETRDRARAALELYAQSLDGALRKFEVIPELLAQRSEVIGLFQTAGDPAAVARANRLTEEVARTAGAEQVYFMDGDGLTFAASNWAGERPFVGQNFSFRPYFREAMDGRLGRYVALGTTSNKRGFYFAYPVRDAGRVLGAVVVKVDIDRIEQRWALSKDAVIVSDSNGVIFISNRPEWRFKTLRPLSESVLQQIGRDRQYDLSDLAPLGLEPRPVGGLPVDLVRIRHDTAAGTGPASAEYMLEATQVPEADWTVHILAGTRSARSQIHATVALSMLACVIALLLIAVADQRRRRLVERIAFQKVAAERLEQRVRDRTVDLSETNRRLEDEIREHETTEAALRRTQGELVQAGKLAALGQMSAALSHEFNQPLAAIRSYAENAAMLIGRKRMDEARDNCGRIRDLTGRMAEISKHLNAFARKPRTRLAAVDLDGVIDDTLQFLRSRLDAAGAVVEVDLPAPAPKVLAGRVRLQQVLTNLVVNALDAMEGMDSARIEISAVADDRRVRLCVRDHGPGIAENVLPTIFDPFVTTKEVGRGLGLGLSISYNIIKDFEGSLGARNHADGGAVFTIELPLLVEPALAEPAE